MAEPGTFLDFAKRILDGGGLRNNGDSLGEMMPPEMGKPDGSIVSPGEMMKRKDMMDCPGCVTNEDGSFATDQSNPFLDALKKRQGPAEQGTMRNFINRMSGHPVDVGSTSEFVAPGTADAATTDPTPMANQPQPGLKPKSYAVPTALPPAALPQLRSSLLTGAGLDPAMYTPDGPDANSLSGRMNSPNSNAEINQSKIELQRIEDDMRGFDGARKERLKKRSDAGENNTQVADVQNLHPAGTFNSNTQSGDVINGVARSLGIGPPNNVIRVPYPLTRRT